MGYCTVTQLRTSLAPDSVTDANPTTDTRTAADLSNAQLQDAIDQASSMVDVAISARYATPVAPIDPDADVLSYPHPIDYWARDIAAYLATCVNRGSIDFTTDDPIYRRYATTLASLTSVQNGSGALPLQLATTSSGTVGAGAAVNPYLGRLFDACDFDLGPAVLPGSPFPTERGLEQGWW